MIKLILILVTFINIRCSAEEERHAPEPPFTDYCEMLARDIEGKMHSFIAGNHMFYIGVKVNTEWNHQYHETIGFTHPILGMVVPGVMEPPQGLVA
jgi:hypothetical protein